MTLRSQLREDYNRDGYVLAPVDGAVDGVSRDIGRLFSKQSSTYCSQLFDDIKFLFLSDIKKYIYTLRTCAKLMSLQELFLSTYSTINELGISFPVLIPPTIHVVSDELKIPDGYHGAFAHQDWPSLQGSLDVITVWIPFMEVGRDNFTLEVIPGSHKNGLLPGAIDGSVLKIECDESKFIPLEIKKGEALFFSGFLIHRTRKEGSGFRIAASQRFENASELTFIERGYPCSQTRVVDRNIYWKPTVEQIRSVYA